MTGKFLKIGFIGGGKMAQAMAKGFIAAGRYRNLSRFRFWQIWFVDYQKETREKPELFLPETCFYKEIT